MYTLQPINVLPPCSPSKVMYQLPNILADKHDGSHIGADIDAKMPDNVITEQKPLRDYSALEARQEKVLDQLAKLKVHVQTLCHFLKQSDRIETRRICVPLGQELKDQVKLDIVVYANPYKPPYSILALQDLWEDTTITLKSYVHSTIEESVEVPDLSLSCNSKLVAKEHVINISLIWKKVDQLQFVIDLSTHPIFGEVNLLRYLSRSIDVHNYEKNLKLYDNRILDLCYRLSEAKKFTGSMMSKLDELESLVSMSEMFLRGDLPRLPDIAVWSTMKQLFQSNSLNILPKSTRTIYRICETIFMDETVHKDE